MEVEVEVVVVVQRRTMDRMLKVDCSSLVSGWCMYVQVCLVTDLYGGGGDQSPANGGRLRNAVKGDGKVEVRLVRRNGSVGLAISGVQTTMARSDKQRQ